MGDSDYRVTLEDQDFYFNGGPISNPAGAQRALQAIGHVAAAWARVEQHVDAILIQVNKEQHSNEILALYNEDRPRPFTDKIRLLKRYFNKHPALQQHTASIRKLAPMLAQMALERNTYLHSIFESYDAQTQIVIFHSIRPAPGPEPYIFRFSKFEVPIEFLERFPVFVNKLNDSLEGISREIFTLDAVARLQKP